MKETQSRSQRPWWEKINKVSPLEIANGRSCGRGQQPIFFLNSREFGLLLYFKSHKDHSEPKPKILKHICQSVVGIHQVRGTRTLLFSEG